MRILLLLFPVLLAGCAGFTLRIAGAPPPPVVATCEGGGNCRFVNSPVKVDREQMRRLPSRALPFFPTTEPLEFVDGRGREWVAPKGILTDGASIPKVFIGIIGNPASREFANAAAVHDAYCGVGNEKTARYRSAAWQDVHVMFYDGLRVGGVGEVRAKLMFAAVWLGGPRWGEDVNFDPSRQNDAPMRAAMRRTKTYVEAENPSIPDLVAFIWEQERSIQAHGATAEGRGAGTGPNGDGPAGVAGGPPAGGPPAAGPPSPGPSAPSGPSASDQSGQSDSSAGVF